MKFGNITELFKATAMLLVISAGATAFSAISAGHQTRNKFSAKIRGQFPKKAF